LNICITLDTMLSFMMWNYTEYKYNTEINN
jgi:hypothetical protein